MAVTTGCVKQLFMAWTSDQARMYDMSMRFAASPMEPVSAMSSKSSALPGPKAISDPYWIRKRGRSEKVLACFFDLAMVLKHDGKYLPVQRSLSVRRWARSRAWRRASIVDSV